MKTVKTGLETAVEQATVTTVTTTFKVSEERQQEIQIDLANEVFEDIYSGKQFEISVRSIQKKLGRWKETDGYTDNQQCQDLLVSALYERLTHARINTLEKYKNSVTEQNKLLSNVVTGVVDDERNGGKIYEVKREKVETDSGVEIKQVRTYANQVSFDKEFNTDSDVSFSLGDSISVDDIRVPDMRSINKANVVQVLKNIELFTKPSQGFVAMLFTEGSQKTQELLGITTGNFNKKISQLENWIAKKHEGFSQILTAEEQEHVDSLSGINHFEILLDVAERTQVMKWLNENKETPWVKYILDEKVDNYNEVLSSWDKQGMRKNSYQFINGLSELKATYQKSVSR